jgi:hypothetical protein
MLVDFAVYDKQISYGTFDLEFLVQDRIRRYPWLLYQND